MHPANEHINRKLHVSDIVTQKFAADELANNCKRLARLKAGEGAERFLDSVSKGGTPSGGCDSKDNDALWSAI